jgi:hypothetical protein
MKTSTGTSRKPLGRVSTATKGNAFSVSERIGLHEATGIGLVHR